MPKYDVRIIDRYTRRGDHHYTLRVEQYGTVYCFDVYTFSGSRFYYLYNSLQTQSRTQRYNRKPNKCLTPLQRNIIDYGIEWMWAVYVVGDYMHLNKYFRMRPFRDLPIESTLVKRRVRLAAIYAARERLDRLIEYTTRPGSEWTQKLMTRQLK